MAQANGDGQGEKSASAGIERRKLLQLTGASAIGVAAMGEAAAVTGQSQIESTHEFVFYQCNAVCTNTSGNYAIIHRDGEYTCERIDMELAVEKTTWTHDHTFCYDTNRASENEEDGQSGGDVVAAIEENDYRGDEHVGEGCLVCLNPNDCVADYLPDDPCTIVDELEDCGPCLDSRGSDIIDCGRCASATSASEIEVTETSDG